MSGNPPLRSHNNLKGWKKLKVWKNMRRKNRRNVRKSTPKEL